MYIAAKHNFISNITMSNTPIKNCILLRDTLFSIITIGNHVAMRDCIRQYVFVHCMLYYILLYIKVNK